MTFDASDPMKVAHKSRDAKAYERRMDNVLAAFMAGQNNREFMYGLLEECHLFRNPFATDALITAFQCGEMNVGQKVLARLQRSCPQLYSKMIEEEHERRALKHPGPDAESDSDSADGPIN